MELSEADRKGLVRESYRMDGITLGECQSIFIDWALSLKDADPHEAMRALLALDYPLWRSSQSMTAAPTERDRSLLG